jgi:hypothetical protein
VRFCGICGQRIVVSTFSAERGASAPRPLQEAASGAPEPAARRRATTLVGAGAAAAASASTGSARAEGQARAAHATLLGMPAMQPTPTHRDQFNNKGKQATLLGMPEGPAPASFAAPAVPSPAESAPAPRAAAQAPEAKPMGSVAAGEGAAPRFGAPSRSRQAVSYDPRLAGAPEVAPPRRPWLLPMLGGAAFTLLLLGVALGLYLAYGRGARSSVRARASRSAGQLSLVVDVSNPPEGARVRFGEEERPLEGGRAVFALADDRLAVGDNRLELGVVTSGGEVEREVVEVPLAYRLSPDFAGLDQEPPRLRIRVEARPGTSVTIAGAEVALDAGGRGARELAVEGRPDDHSLVQTVAYRIQPPGGAVEEGEVRARIPVATLAIDRPGRSLVTDHAEVAVEGAAHPTATVTVDGAVVPVVAGHFKHRVAFDELGERTIEVIAREPGALRERVRLTVRRVADLVAEADAYPVDPSLTYEAIAADPAGHRGARVGFEGLVYNVEVHRGHSMLQVLASRCPEGRRCPLWVTYPAATDAELDRWVRVLGEVDGEQHFRTVGDRDQVMTVPRIRAVYVLPVTR